jgi:GGDEF domain-containing protein
LINDGEYLLLFPHQSQEEANRTMEKILQALQLRFFAYLGEFSATLAYSVERPNFQDVDPYIFLSQLSTAVKSYKECT